MKVAVIDDYQDVFRKLDCYASLKDFDVGVFHTAATGDLLAERLRDAEAVILTMQRTAMPRELLQKLPNLKLISQTGRNTGHIDINACKEKGIVVSAGGSGGPHPTVELAWALILSAMRHIPQEVQSLKAGEWQTTLGAGLAGKTLGIYAYGRIGSLVAKIGHAFGMNIICWGRDGSLSRALADGFQVAANRDSFFESADVLTLHLQLNAETRGIVTSGDLARMKAGSLIVNTSRAQIIADGALAAALRLGRPSAAAIDVFETEPVLDGHHELLSMKNVICTPHLGYVEKGNYEAMFKAAIDQVIAFRAGHPINVIQAA